MGQPVRYGPLGVSTGEGVGDVTTIITDGTVIVADTGITDGDARLEWGGRKIQDRYAGRNPRTVYFAFSGALPLFDVWVNWYLMGRLERKPPPAKVPGCSPDILWVIEPLPNGHGGLLVEFNSDAPYEMKMGVPAVAGSGSKFALGALALGHSPQEALQAAMACDPYTFGEALVVELPETHRIQAHRGVPGSIKLPCRSSSPRSPSRE